MDPWIVLQDEVSFVVEKGWSPEFVLWMDILAFRGLVESCERREVKEKKEFLHLQRLAAHGDEEAMKDQEWSFNQDLQALGNKVEASKGNAASFLKKYGGGI